MRCFALPLYHLKFDSAVLQVPRDMSVMAARECRAHLNAGADALDEDAADGPYGRELTGIRDEDRKDQETAAFLAGAL